MKFDEIYKSLNPAQKKAVDIIDGPVMVIAGPGTGKTQLLATRVANILRQDSTLLPTNILCLTFSESGQVAMQRRLIELMGQTGAHVAVHTFHSFGVEIINSHPEYFYRGVNFSPADELTTHEILTEILQDLPPKNQLSVKSQGEYIYLKPIKNRIEDLKKSALEPQELLDISLDNLKFIDYIEPSLVELFDVKSFSSVSDIEKSTKVLDFAAKYRQPPLKVPTFKPLSRIFLDTFGQAVEQALEIQKTKPINQWKTDWFKKDDRGRGVCKQRDITDKLIALSEVYEVYQNRLTERKLFDFADMIMRVVHGLETRPDLAYELQEQYQYFLVDEFQDTNAGQLRLLHALANHPVNEGRPNIMVVGDDDQAIYAFQGAELSNILGFKDSYLSVETIVLTYNYRSSQDILDISRNIIRQGSERLENVIDGLDKTLEAKNEPKTTVVERVLFTNRSHEYEWLADKVDTLIKNGHPPQEIAIISREHKYLESLLPYLFQKNIPTSYERRQDALSQPEIIELISLSRLVNYLAHQNLEDANALMPEVLSADYWQIPAIDIWHLSLEANARYKKLHRETFWLELMLSGEFGANLKQIAEFVIECAKFSLAHPLEETLDKLIGNDQIYFPQHTTEEANTINKTPTKEFASPYKSYYFAEDLLTQRPESYINLLSGLAAIRDQLRNYHADKKLLLNDFISFVDLCTGAKIAINVSGLHGATDNSVRLLSAHGSKGLEFNTVFLMNGVAKVWDKKGQGSLLAMAPNMQNIARKDNPDDRLRLFYVSMTRAKQNLYVSSYLSTDDGKETSSFGALEDPSVTSILPAPTQPVTMPDSSESLLNRSTRQWYDRHWQMPVKDMRSLLAERLSNYQLSVTHLNNFLDIPNGGPLNFLMGNLLQFPSAMSPSAAYGSAMHEALDYLHKSFKQVQKLPSQKEVIKYFSTSLKLKRLSEKDEKLYIQKGDYALRRFILQRAKLINAKQQTELNFYSQGVIVDNAKLTGKIDVLEIKNSKATVFDYKTGKNLRSWDFRGKSVYEQIKTHKYRQQLLFYKLLVDESRTYGDKSIKLESADLVFVEPDKTGEITSLRLSFDDNHELDRLKKLIAAVWNKIQNLDFPDISDYEPTEKGITKFEDWLIGE